MAVDHHDNKNADLNAPDLYTGEPPLKSAHDTWARVQKDLAYALGTNVHRSWTGRLMITDADAFSVMMSAPTGFIATKIESNYRDELQRLWDKHDQVMPPRRVRIVKPLTQVAPSKPKPAVEAPQRVSTPSRSDEPVGNSRRERFTFDNFVVGPCNEFAHAAMRQVATSQTTQYNPIVIYGDNGMGKTHLLYSALKKIESDYPERRVRKISGEQFVNAFVSSFRGHGREAIEAFKTGLRHVDILMIDDAQFVTDKPGSREELLLTLMALVAEDRQVVLTMDSHPNDLENASDRLKSHLNSGLVCKIGHADYEMRIRILDRLIASHRAETNPHLSIPQQARDHLAARIKATPRDLEGVFNQVVAKSEFLGQPITVDTIQETLADSRFDAQKQLTVDRIQRIVAQSFDISMDDMVSKRRARAIARPRQVAMYLCKRLTKRSLPDIGRRFGGRDHTTVMHAVKRITELRQDDPNFNRKVTEVESLLKA